MQEEECRQALLSIERDKIGHVVYALTTPVDEVQVSMRQSLFEVRGERYSSRRIPLPLVPLCGDNIMSKKGLGSTGAPSP